MSWKEPVLDTELATISSELLSSNSSLLALLMQYNEAKQENELLQFMKMEGGIMREDVIRDKIPVLKDSIIVLRQKIRQREANIQEMKGKIGEVRNNIEKTKNKISKIYEQRRNNMGECRLLENKKTVLRESRRSSVKKDKDHEKIIDNLCKIKLRTKRIQNQQAYEKENIGERSNTTTNTTTNRVTNADSNPRQKIISLKTNNNMVEKKLASLKQEIKSKATHLEEVKKQRRQIINNFEERGRKTQSMRSSNMRSRSRMRSQFISIEDQQGYS